MFAKFNNAVANDMSNIAQSRRERHVQQEQKEQKVVYKDKGNLDSMGTFNNTIEWSWISDISI